MMLSSLPFATALTVASILSMTVKVCLILFVAGLVSLALRDASAAARHLVWTLAIVVILVLPVGSSMLPTWNINLPVNNFWSAYDVPAPSAPSAAPVAPAAVAPVELVAPAAVAPLMHTPVVPHATPGDAGTHANEHAHLSTPVTVETHGVNEAAAIAGVTPAASTASSLPPLRTILAAIWIMGFLLVLGRLITGLLGLRRITSQAVTVTDPATLRIVDSVRRQLGIERQVEIRKTSRKMPPFTVGIRNPMVILPNSGEIESEERLRIVLLHELAHIKRFDWLTQIVGEVACAVHWFNPLVWIAHTRQQVEQEMACDNAVLNNGASPSSYATSLLDIVRDMRSSSWPVYASTAMARTSTFEGRVLAILDSSRIRSGLYPLRAVGLAMVLMVLTVPIVAMQPVGAESVVTAETETLESPPVVGPEIDRVAETPASALPVPPPVSAAAPVLSNSEEEGEEPAGTTNVVEIPRSADVLDSPEGISRVTSEEETRVEDKSSESLVTRAKMNLESREEAAVDTTKLFAMIRALNDEEPEVRKTAIYILGEMEDPRAIDALGKILTSDPLAELRSRAAWALGEIEDERAIPALMKAVEDENGEVRKNVVWALGQIESEDALPALSKAAKDPNPKVRKNAIWAIGEIESPAAVGILTEALKDDDEQVRRSAAWGLGELEDDDAIPGLVVALRDMDSEVRRYAAIALAESESMEAVEPLMLALKDENEEVRRMAVWGLGELEALEAVGALSLALANDVSEDVRKNAAWALAEIESSEAIPALVVAMNDLSVEVRRTAIYALGELEDTSAMPGFLRALSDDDEEIRSRAAWALGEIESQEAVEALIKAARDDSPRVRKSAIFALGEIQDPRAEEVLLYVLANDPDKDIRKAAAHAIAELD